MFTVKHIVPNSFDEIIWEAESVRYGISPTTQKPTVWVEMNHEVTGSLDGGIVYVMNREGATIAKYDMRPPQQFSPPEAARSIDQR